MIDQNSVLVACNKVNRDIKDCFPWNDPLLDKGIPSLDFYKDGDYMKISFCSYPIWSTNTKIEIPLEDYLKEKVTEIVETISRINFSDVKPC